MPNDLFGQPLPKKKRKKARDRVWDILCDAWGVRKPAGSQRGELNRACEGLRAKYEDEDELVELLPTVIDRMRTHLVFHREKQDDHRTCVEPHKLVHRWEEFLPPDKERLEARFKKWQRSLPETAGLDSHVRWVLYLRIEGASLPKRLQERARTRYLDERRQVYAPDLTQAELDERLDKWEAIARESAAKDTK